MGLNRLDNFLKSVRGAVIYVNPDSLDATDAIENQGNSAARPFITIQRALIEAARFSYQSGLNNDRFDKTTIVLYPGEHVVDNRPGWLPDWEVDDEESYILRNGTRSVQFKSFDYSSNFNLNDPSNDLYKFNSIYGGVIVPRGTSIVGMDLRKTKIRPRYVPDPQNNTIERSAIFRLTGGSYIWKFTIFDANPNGKVYKNYTSNTFLPNFSHHKLTAFEYADGTNPVEIRDSYIPSYTSSRTDLDIYYNKIGLAYGTSSGRTIDKDYPSPDNDIQSKVDEYRIVGSRGIESSITKITSGDGVISSNKITVEFEQPIPGVEVDTPIQIRGISISGYSGQFVVSKVLNPKKIEYITNTIPSNPAPTSEQIIGSVISIAMDTVTSASPYIFNVSIRSVYGMCGLHADGNKASGFKSMVVAQFTGIGLQKDDNAFVKYSPQFGLYQDKNSVTNLFSDSKSLFKPEYQNYHIKASNNAFIQVVSVFAIGFSEHFKCESGGDLSITNSNSNFGSRALVSDGYRPESFDRDDVGYITHIITPEEIESNEINVEFESIDIIKTLEVNDSKKLFLYNRTNRDIVPENVIDGFRIGAKKDDLLYTLIPINGEFVERTAKIVMGGSQTSQRKSFKVAKKVNEINNEISFNTITLTQPHNFINGEKVRVISDNGQLPDGITSQVYYVITSQTNDSLQPNQIRLSTTINDALDGGLSTSAISIYSNEQSNLKIISDVSDKKSGDIGHPIQWDTFYNSWYIAVEEDNSIFNSLSQLSNQLLTRSYIKRISELRNITDSIYKFRYVIPKDSPVTARPPSEGFVIQESSDTTGETSEVIKYNSILNRQLSNTTELRNFRFISNATWENNVATFTTEVPHDLSVGCEVEIKNVTSIQNQSAEFNKGYNKRFTVSSISSRRTFSVSLPTNPGTFTNNVSRRDKNLPYYRKVNFKSTYSVYKSQEIQPYIKDEQDGIYHLLVVSSAYSPSLSPFNNLKFSQPVQNLYPQVNRDNPKSDPPESSSFALSYPIGQVVVNDPELSLTKETLYKFTDDLNVGIAVTNIVSSSNGLEHTIFTNVEHGLNRITVLEVIDPGSGYGNSRGIVSSIYNATLVGLAGSVTGEGATVAFTHDTSNKIVRNSIRIIDGGSSYSVGDQLQVITNSIQSDFTPARVVVRAIYNDIGSVVKINGVKSDNFNELDEYNNLYRITGIDHGVSRRFRAVSATQIENPKVNGVPFKNIVNSRVFFNEKSTLVSSINYSNTTGICTVTTSTVHGLKLNNKITLSGSNNQFFNRSFVISKIVSTKIFEVNCGISTTEQIHSGQSYVYRDIYTSNGGKVTKSNENISSRLNVEYNGITTNLATTINDANLDQIDIENIQSLDFKLGDYLIIDDEIMRIKRSVTGNPVYVYRGVLGTRKANHTLGSVIRRIKPRPIEFRRNSIIRASGHTFEYVGYGPGNYSTAFPEKQDRQLSGKEQLLSHATKINGGTIVFTGMNDSGDFYIGNKRINSSTGREEVYDTPITTVTGEDINEESTGNSIGVDVNSTAESYVSRSLYVGGGSDNNIISKFDGPVVFNNKITSKSEKGIEVSSIFVQGDAATSRKYSVGITLPSYIGNTGDITYNANPNDYGFVGWVYTLENSWRRFGPIQGPDGRYVGVWSGRFYGDGAGLINVSDIWDANEIGINVERLVGVNTNTAKVGVSLYVIGNTEITGNMKVFGKSEFLDETESTTKDNGSFIIKGGLGVAKNINAGGSADIGGGADIGGDVNIGGHTDIGGDVDIEGGVNIGEDIYVAGLSTFIGDSKFGGDINVYNQPIRSLISGYSIVFGL